MTPCIDCGTLTDGSTGASGIFWTRICQPCKDRVDRLALSKALAILQRPSSVAPSLNDDPESARSFCEWLDSQGDALPMSETETARDDDQVLHVSYPDGDSDEKLTPAQVENWRNVLCNVIGPSALIMPESDIQACKDETQRRSGDNWREIRDAQQEAKEQLEERRGL